MFPLFVVFKGGRSDFEFFLLYSVDVAKSSYRVCNNLLSYKKSFILKLAIEQINITFTPTTTQDILILTPSCGSECYACLFIN